MADSPFQMERFGLLNRVALYRLFITSALLYFAHRTQPGRGSDFAISSPQVMYGFVGGLFLITLVYLFWLRTRWGLELLARVQCAMDPILVSVLVVLTGGSASPMHVLFALAVLNTAFVLGRRDALIVAGMSLLLSIGSITVASALFRMPLEADLSLLRRIVLHGTLFTLTAVLAGALASQAKGLRTAFDLQKDDLAELAALNQQILQAMPFGLVTVNAQGVVHSVNQAAALILRSPVSHMMGRRFGELFPLFQDLLQRPPRLTLRQELTHRERILGVSASPLMDHRDQEIGTLLVFEDLSERKRLEQELAERDKLAFTGRMAAYVAHEVRNPLASILSAVQMLEHTALAAQRKRLQGIILEEIGRLNQLITDFLMFARPPTPHRQEVDLLEALEGLRSQMGHDPRWGLERCLELDVEGVVRFDPNHLRQVFWNLLINAAHAMAEQGKVRITARSAGGVCHVMVVDDGPGMTPEVLQHALEPFYTTRSTGTGLGLTVVAQLVRLNGGSIHLQNGEDGGLEVRLVLDGVVT